MAKVELLDDPEGTVPQTFRQLGIFLIDGSFSMSEEAKNGLRKHQEVNLAVREALTRFKFSRVKSCFSFAVVVFGLNADIHTPPTLAEIIDDNGNYDPLNPSIVDGSATFIGAGLAKCKQIIDDFFADKIDGVPNKVAIVTLSDGMSEATKTKEIADSLRLNHQVEIYCCHLPGLSADADLEKAKAILLSLCGDPGRYKTVYDAETIREFFIASITSSAGIGKNG